MVYKNRSATFSTLKRDLVRLANENPDGIRKHLLPLLRTASSISVRSVEFVAGQEPDTQNEEFVTDMYATFTIGGKLLAGLANKQDRVMVRFLEKLKKERKEHLLLRLLESPPSGRPGLAVKEIMRVLRKHIKREVSYYAMDDGAQLRRLSIVDFSVDSDWTPTVKINPRSGSVTFEDVELEIVGEFSL